jgi:DNA-binding beta-propeller fold protein YncE
MITPSRTHRAITFVGVLIGLACLLPAACPQDNAVVGPAAGGGTLVPTGQLVRPAGQVIAYSGRPVDLALSANSKYLYVKDNTGLLVLDAASWKLQQRLPFTNKQGGSIHGLALSRDGKRLYATTAQNILFEAEVAGEGQLTWRRKITLAGPEGKGASHATGIALSKDGKRAFVCLSRNNSLGVVDLDVGKLSSSIPVGVAPYAVQLSADETIAYVSNWGGRRPKPGERTAPSSGTPTLVDSRGIASSGTVCRVDLKTGKMLEQVETGLHPAGLALSGDGKTLFVANANSDTVTLLETDKLRVLQSLPVRPDPALPFGSATNALALAQDGKTLFAANGGNNAVAVLGLREGRASVQGFIPAGWYPGAVVCDGKYLFIANVKGEGSRSKTPGKAGWGVYGYRGTVTRVPLPSSPVLAGYTKQVRADTRTPQILQALEKGSKSTQPVPVPARIGEPSVFEHVVYVVKENRTYDQVFGDLKQGNGDPKLCLFGRDVSPNHHALAERYVLLDNFYCNGVLSADGHSWATEGNVTDHLEKSFGGFTRSYTFGDDPLTYSSSGFIWDGVLLSGRSFRNSGEMRDTTVVGKKKFAEVWKDYRSGKNAVRFTHTVGIETLARFTAPDYPGWCLDVSDQQRMDAFLTEFREYEKKGRWLDFMIVHLPQDHTAGTSPDAPTPAACVADNDLAVGRLVEAISHSKFWKKTCIFIIEDDPQDGFDHIDGHRSTCLVISPYTKRKQVVSKFYNQTSVLHTMERILGLPALTQFDGRSPLMTDCFTDTPDFSTYKALPAKVPLDQMNRPLRELRGAAREWALKSLAQDLSHPDRVDDDTFNRILWYAVKGEAPYPATLAGAHGRGLKALGLRLETSPRDKESRER